MEKPLAGKTVAILVANGFEETEMTEPQRALLAAGATVKVISPEQGLVNGWHSRSWGHYFPVDVAISEALAADFDALIVPGGERSIEKLAGNAHAKRLTKGFADGGKPMIMVNHAPALLAAAERAAGKTIVADPEIAEQLATAGATVVTEDTMKTDGRLMTAAGEYEVNALKAALVDHIAETEGNPAAAAA